MLFCLTFNGDNKQCLCIMPQNFNHFLNNTFDLSILSNNSCDRYCDNRFSDSNVKNKFKCGSSRDSRIWAIYNLNLKCPIGSFYIQELKECIFLYSGYSDSCPSLSVNYVYDGNVNWTIFLQAIQRLNLTNSNVNIDFDVDVTIDPSWKCSTAETGYREYFTSNTSEIRSDYVLDSGCLRLRRGSYSYSFSVYSYRMTNRLCIPNRMNERSSLDYTDYTDYYRSYGNTIDNTWDKCPSGWLDINKNCYKISEDRKTIQEAKNRCINFSKDEIKNATGSFIPSYRSDGDDDIDDDMDEMADTSKTIMSDFLKGEIVQYTSQWEVRLGFFLLDKMSTLNINDSSINEFQMINPNDDNNSSIKDDSCLVVSRTIINKNESFILKTQSNNCSSSRHVLCTTKSILDLSFKIGCFSKPLTLDLPVMISNHLTYELCLSVCGNLKTNLAVINMNKCYCLNVEILQIQNLIGNRTKSVTTDCGNPCSGNHYERCGNTNTMVVLREDNESTYLNRYVENDEQHKPYPNVVYHSCIDLSTVNESGIYELKLTHKSDVHPRHCSELCANYKQRYSLLNSNRCLCTNILMKKSEVNPFTSFLTIDNNCTQECEGNYFYTCGNANNSKIYSVYVVELQCPPGFEVTADEIQCVYKNFSEKTNSFSTAQSYCKSVGSVLAKINDILEIQDIISQSKLTERELSIFSRGYDSTLSETTKYFWIDRTSDMMNNKKKTDRSIETCFRTSKSIDRNCIVLRRETILINNVLSEEWCFTESDQCSSISAIPICVDKHLQLNSIKFPRTTDADSSIISINITTDYSCDEDTEYHFIDGYCYKVLFHETTWNDAKLECERENATLFLPEKFAMLSSIKSLFLRHHSYTSSGIAHVGMFYDNQTRIITQYNRNGESLSKNASYIYDIDIRCQRKLKKDFEEFMSLPMLSTYTKNRSKNQQIRCAYIDFRSQKTPSISCGAGSCNRLATVICQKSPIVTTRTVIAEIDYTNIPMNDKSSPTLKSIGISITTVLLLLSILFVFIIIGLIYTVQNRYSKRKNNNRHQTDRLNNEYNYSQLLIKNESDQN